MKSLTMLHAFSASATAEVGFSCIYAAVIMIMAVIIIITVIASAKNA